jgi:predicted thioesterase
MKPSLAAGISRTERITIDRDRTIGFMGEELRVYSTPRMVLDMEYTSRNLIIPHLDAGEDSVGTRVEVDHLAAALNGSWVDVTSTLTKVEGRRVTFDVVVRDAIEEIGRCIHTRFVVDTEKTRQRLVAKAEKLKATK